MGSTGDSLWLCWGGSAVSWILLKNPNKINKPQNGSHNLKGRLILLRAYRWISIAGLGVMLVSHKTKTNPCSGQGSLCHCTGSCCLFHLIFQSQSFGLSCHSWSLVKARKRIQNKHLENISSLKQGGWRNTRNTTQIGLYTVSAQCPCFVSRYFTFLFQLSLEYLQFPWVYKLGSQQYAAKQFPAKGCAVTGRQALPSLPTALSKALS